MAKGKQDRVAKAERKLTKAQAELEDAMTRYAKAEKQGNKEIEKAQALAEQWKAKARARVEQQQEVVAGLETRLLELKGQQAASTSELLVTTDGAPSTSDLVASPNGNNGLMKREAQALDALRQISQEPAHGRKPATSPTARSPGRARR
jgi:chromosome segregation ATPase